MSRLIINGYCGNVGLIGRLLRIKYFYQPDLGFRVAKVRNEGIKLAAYENILLLDSGMIASEDLLSIHLNIHSKQTEHAVIGMSYGVNEFDNANTDKLLHILSNESKEELFTELSRRPELNDCRYDYLASQQFDISSSTAPWSVFWTGHVSFKKSSFNSIGGFDEWFCSWGGEDVDLGIRLYKRGCNFYLIDTIEAIHHPHYKDSRDKELSSQKNIEYICNKFKCTEVDLLRKYSWIEILISTSLY
ncbi:MAG: galactosyltransferase-related protein [Cellvibrio sp.]|uniref:galactosyltransferase-related protein n=1 Tax=Cellvibrio sp. TaxID=1965322 RepID=UPI00271E1FAF|nr:galactosyltransferase-related protein [Cellvibrio sp.]